MTKWQKPALGINQLLIAVLALVSALLFSSIVIVDWFRIKNTLRQDFLSEAFTTSRGIEYVVASTPPGEVAEAGFAAIQRALLADPDLVSASILLVRRGKLEVISSSLPAKVGSSGDTLSVQAYSMGKLQHTFRASSLHLVEPIFTLKTNQGVIDLHFTLEDLHAEALSKWLKDLWVVLAITLVLATSLYLTVRRQILQPLWQIIERTKSQSKQIDHALPSLGFSNEFGDLSRSIQHMTREILEAKTRETNSSNLEAIGQLAGGIAHDFNNLMSVVSSSLQLLEDAQSAAERKNLTQTALRALEHGASLTKQMLALGRRSPLRPEILNLNEEVREFTGFIRRVLPPNIALELRLPTRAMGAFLDRGMLQSALLNLCLNSKSAMPKGGELRISVDIQECAGGLIDQSATAPLCVVLTVSDTGGGIEAELLDRVFEPFFTTSEVGQGSGLGLSMVKGFAEQSEGYVELFSQVGSGTRVVLGFPLRDIDDDQNRVAQMPRLPFPEAFDQPKVLVVEDDPQLVALIGLKLERDGFHVTKKSTADDALHTLRKDRAFDVVLTDMVMPGKNQGGDVLRYVKNNIPNLPVVLMSGYVEPVDAGREDLSRADEFVEKPLDLQHLSELLLELSGQGTTGQAPARTLPDTARRS